MLYLSLQVLKPRLLLYLYLVFAACRDKHVVVFLLFDVYLFLSFCFSLLYFALQA